MNKILIYEDSNEFLQVIEQLQKEYNKTYKNQTIKEAGNYE